MSTTSTPLTVVLPEFLTGWSEPIADRLRWPLGAAPSCSVSCWPPLRYWRGAVVDHDLFWGDGAPLTRHHNRPNACHSGPPRGQRRPRRRGRRDRRIRGQLGARLTDRGQPPSAHAAPRRARGTAPPATGDAGSPRWPSPPEQNFPPDVTAGALRADRARRRPEQHAPAHPSSPDAGWPAVLTNVTNTTTDHTHLCRHCCARTDVCQVAAAPPDGSPTTTTPATRGC